MKAYMALAIIAGMFIGAGAGVGTYTFWYAHGASYMTDDPAACANCHIMDDHYDSWLKSSHHHVAVCNDCHTPHNFVGKYLSKAENGFNHSWAFVTGWFHEPIQITPKNREITEQACRHCHSDIVQAIDPLHALGQALSCLQCHGNVGHM